MHRARGGGGVAGSLDPGDLLQISLSDLHRRLWSSTSHLVGLGPFLLSAVFKCTCAQVLVKRVFGMMPSSLAVRNSKASGLGDLEPQDGARNLANTCPGCVSFVGSKPVAMFRFLLAAMVFVLVDATLLVCAATPAAMASAALWRCPAWARPGDCRLLVFLGGPLGPDCLQPYPGRPAAKTNALMDATGMAAMGALCWAATMDVCCDFLSACARGSAASRHEQSALHGVRVGTESLERQLTL